MRLKGVRRLHQLKRTHTIDNKLTHQEVPISTAAMAREAEGVRKLYELKRMKYAIS